MTGSSLTPGQIDARARTIFRYGGCSALAIALHDATRWPILAVTDSHNVDEGRTGGGSALHWGVRHPSGMFLDIEGLHRDEDLIEEYEGEADDGEAAVGIAARADAMEWYGNGTVSSTISLALAGTFVAPLFEIVASDKPDQRSS